MLAITVQTCCQYQVGCNCGPRSGDGRAIYLDTQSFQFVIYMANSELVNKLSRLLKPLLFFKGVEELPIFYHIRPVKVNLVL